MLKMNLLLALTILLFICSGVNCDESKSAANADESRSAPNADESKSAPNADHENFKRLFQEKRLYQLRAVKQLQSLDPEKQIKLLDAMIVQMLTVLVKSRNKLIESGYEVEGGGLPEDEQLRESLALVVENTCLASDLLLRFPHYFHKKLRNSPELDSTYKWALGFTQEMAESLLDTSAGKLMNLALQELGLVEMSEDYVNPYKKDLNEKEREPKKLKFADPPQAKKKERKKLAKGPRMAKSEL
jgi:hypothetical protein